MDKITTKKAKEVWLSRPEATMLANWLVAQGKKLPLGWMEIWKLYPSEVAHFYEVKISDVLIACRRERKDE